MTGETLNRVTRTPNFANAAPAGADAETEATIQPPPGGTLIPAPTEYERKTCEESYHASTHCPTTPPAKFCVMRKFALIVWPGTTSASASLSAFPTLAGSHCMAFVPWKAFDPMSTTVKPAGNVQPVAPDSTPLLSSVTGCGGIADSGRTSAPGE